MDSETLRLAIVTGASQAMDYKSKNPRAEIEEVLQFVMKAIKAEEKTKIAAIAAASRAMKYREKFPKEADKEIIQRVLDESNMMVQEIK